MIKEELKKIWKPGMVLLLVFLGFIFYSMFLEFYIRYFPNGPQAMGVFQVGKEWVEKYGTSLSSEEAMKVKENLPKLYQEADGWIQKLDLAKSHGLVSYQDYIKFSETSLEEVFGSQAADLNTDYADAMRIHQYLNSQETGNIDGRIYGVEHLLQFYEMEQQVAESYRMFEKNEEGTKELQEAEREEHTYNSRFYLSAKKQYSERELKNIQKNFYNETADWQNILPSEVVETTALYISYLLIWICFSICILLSPLLVYDQMSRIRAIQYSSKRGRKLLQIQWKAVMLSAFLLTTFHLLLFGGIFLTNGIKVFFPCKMYSFQYIDYCWANWSYQVWCLALIGLVYFVAMGTAGIAFFLSKYSTNYIGMLLKLVPFFVGIAILCPKLLYQAFYYNNALYKIIRVPYIEVIVVGVILLIGIGLCRKEVFFDSDSV